MKKCFFEKEWKALGTDISLLIVTEVEMEQEDRDRIFSEIRKIYESQEKIFSRFDSQSELSALNSHLDEFVEVSPDMLHLVSESLEYFHESGGMFDPRVITDLERIGYVKSFQENSFAGKVGNAETARKRELKEDLIIENSKVKFLCRMDFSGIAKGYITDKAAQFLRKKGFRNFLIDSGGDMFASGKDMDGDSWGIALEGSRNEEEIMVELSDMAIATSGNVRRNWKNGDKRFHHLINPYQPNSFSFAVQSVSVVEETVEKADVWAKILFLLGQEKGMEKAKAKKIQAFFLQLDGSIISSNNI